MLDLHECGSVALFADSFPPRHERAIHRVRWASPAHPDAVRNIAINPSILYILAHPQAFPPV